MKVLIGVDGSPHGFAAARQAGEILSAERDQVTLFYSPPQVRLAHDAAPEMINRARAAIAEAVFDESKKHLPAAMHGALTTMTGTQPAKRGLITAADEMHADLIVVGATGAGPINDLLLGSVSKAVLHAAKAPVLVVREPPQAKGPGPRVLAAFDGSEASLDAVQMLGRFSWPPTTLGRLLTVIEPMFVGEIPPWLAHRVRGPDTEAMAQAWVKGHAEEKNARQAELKSLAEKLPEAFRHAPPIVAEGNAAEQILATIAAENSDLVVLGARGQGAWERMLIGSTAETVIAHAPCSVLVVRRHERP